MNVFELIKLSLNEFELDNLILQINENTEGANIQNNKILHYYKNNLRQSKSVKRNRFNERRA